MEFDGAPTIPSLSAMPEGASTFDALDAMNRGDPDEPTVWYLPPYKFFLDTPFTGVLSPPFPGVHPIESNNLLNLGLDPIRDKVVRTTELVLDTDTMEAGIVNIPFPLSPFPFIERQAGAALMRSTFWIMELNEEGPFGEPRLLLAYSQFVFLDFSPRRDGRDGVIRCAYLDPHDGENRGGSGLIPVGRRSATPVTAIPFIFGFRLGN